MAYIFRLGARGYSANKPLQNGEHIDYGAAYGTIHVQKIEHLGRPAEGIEGSREVAAFEMGLVG